MIIQFQYSIMNKYNNISFFLLHLIIFLNSIHHINPQTLSDNNTVVSDSRQDSVSNFQPSLAVVIGMLTVMFCLTFLLILYAKFCHQASQVQHTPGRIQDGLLRSRDQQQQQQTGLDKTVIESLPFFRFLSLKGSKEGLECAVCLAKFEDVEVLRLLPKCKHAFHIDCIDQWLEKHSTCPLCRHMVTAEDLAQVPYSNSLRFLWNQSERREESNLELFVQREENSSSARHGSSSRFSIGSSFRKLSSKKEDELLPIQDNYDENGKVLRKTNHKIVVSDVVLKHRWSNVSSSDIMFLNSEMLNDMSSARFSNFDSCSGRKSSREISELDGGVSVNKHEFEDKIGDQIKKHDYDSDFPRTSYESSKALSANEKRSMSEILVHPRFGARDVNNVREERRRKLWLPIARKTVQWFANRERSRPLPLHTQEVSIRNN